MSLLLGLFGKAAGLVAGGGIRLWVEIAVVAALLGAVGAQTWRVHSWQAKEGQARAENAQTIALWNKQVAESARAAFAESEKNRAITADLQRKKDEAEHARQVVQQNAARVAAGFAAERAGMRSQLAAYAAPGGSGLAVDTVAACRERAAALGDSLDGSLRAEEDLTDALERSRSDTRSLLDSWPKVTP
jgi:hypothetical protein